MRTVKRCCAINQRLKNIKNAERCRKITRQMMFLCALDSWADFCGQKGFERNVKGEKEIKWQAKLKRSKTDAPDLCMHKKGERIWYITAVYLNSKLHENWRCFLLAASDASFVSSLCITQTMKMHLEIYTKRKKRRQT